MKIKNIQGSLNKEEAELIRELELDQADSALRDPDVYDIEILLPIADTELDVNTNFNEIIAPFEKKHNSAKQELHRVSQSIQSHHLHEILTTGIFDVNGDNTGHRLTNRQALEILSAINSATNIDDIKLALLNSPLLRDIDEDSTQSQILNDLLTPSRIKALALLTEAEDKSMLQPFFNTYTHDPLASDNQILDINGIRAPQGRELTAFEDAYRLYLKTTQEYKNALAYQQNIANGYVALTLPQYAAIKRRNNLLERCLDEHSYLLAEPIKIIGQDEVTPVKQVDNVPLSMLVSKEYGEKIIPHVKFTEQESIKAEGFKINVSTSQKEEIQAMKSMYDLYQQKTADNQRRKSSAQKSNFDTLRQSFRKIDDDSDYEDKKRHEEQNKNTKNYDKIAKYSIALITLMLGAIAATAIFMQIFESTRSMAAFQDVARYTLGLATVGVGAAAAMVVTKSILDKTAEGFNRAENMIYKGMNKSPIKSPSAKKLIENVVDLYNLLDAQDKEKYFSGRHSSPDKTFKQFVQDKYNYACTSTSWGYKFNMDKFAESMVSADGPNVNPETKHQLIQILKGRSTVESFKKIDPTPTPHSKQLQQAMQTNQTGIGRGGR